MPNLPTPRIIRSNRLSISLQVTPKGEIVVKAPFFAPNRIIEKFIGDKVDWITKALEKTNARQVKKKQYKEGEEFMYLGEKKVLTFYDGIEIKIQNEKLLFPKALQFRLQKEITNWFIAQAKEKISQRLDLHANQMRAAYSKVFFSDTSSKWGTCFADNSLQFNWRLIMAPLMVLDYVVIHELAHTTEKNHRDPFWKKVKQFTPAYRQHRKWLTENAHLLIV